jgi:acyl-coenzyme A thioesterase PaaI-like protein
MKTDQEIPNGFKPIQSSNKFGGRNGPIYEKAEANTWTRGFMAEDKHCNAASIVHGGMLMTFADIVLARAVMAMIDPPFVTLRMTSDFISPALNGAWIEGWAKVTGCEGELYFVSGEITSRGKVILGVQGIFKAIRRASRA